MPTAPQGLAEALGGLLAAVLRLWTAVEKDGSAGDGQGLPPGLVHAFDCARRVERETRAVLGSEEVAEPQSDGTSPAVPSLHEALQASTAAIMAGRDEGDTEAMAAITERLTAETLVHAQAQLVGLLIDRGFQVRTVLLGAGVPVGPTGWASLGLSFSDLAAGVSALCASDAACMDTAVAAAVAAVESLLNPSEGLSTSQQGPSPASCFLPSPILQDLESPTESVVSWVRADSARCFTSGKVLQSGTIAGHLLRAHTGQEPRLLKRLLRYRGHPGALQTACLAILWASWDLLGCLVGTTTDSPPALGHSQRALLSCLEDSLRGREPLGSPTDLDPALAAELSWRSFGFCYAYVDAICEGLSTSYHQPTSHSAESDGSASSTSTLQEAEWVARVFHLAGRGLTLRRYTLAALGPSLRLPLSTQPSPVATAGLH